MINIILWVIALASIVYLKYSNLKLRQRVSEYQSEIFRKGLEVKLVRDRLRTYQAELKVLEEVKGEESKPTTPEWKEVRSGKPSKKESTVKDRFWADDYSSLNNSSNSSGSSSSSDSTYSGGGGDFSGGGSGGSWSD